MSKDKTGNSMKSANAGGLGPLQFVLKYGTYFLFLFIVVLLLILNDSFRTTNNAINVLLQNSINGAIAVGMTLVIITGGIDVSVGAIMCASACMGAVLIKDIGAPEWLAIIVVLLMATLFGVINGFSVSYLGMPAFLVTLATQSIGNGLGLVLSGGATYRNLGNVFTFIGKNDILGIPVLIWMLIIMFVVGYFLLHRTVYGRKVLAIGGNPDAARVSGIDVKKVRMSVYIILGFICGIAGIMTAARVGSYWSQLGKGVEFTIIAGVVIGGTSLAGGSGTIPGTFIGVLLMGVISNALNLMGVSAEWQDIAKGIIIFLAVMIDATRNKFDKAD